MPIYEYQCNCGNRFSEIRNEARRRSAKCKCGLRAKQAVSMFSVVTDTNFWYTGKFDTRLGSKIEGRKDFWNKVEKKGYHEIPTKDFAVTTTLEDRMKNIPEPM